MHPLLSHTVSVPLIETYGNIPLGPLPDQGLEKHVDLKHQDIIVQRTLDLIKEEMNKYLGFSFMSYIKPFELKCGV